MRYRALFIGGPIDGQERVLFTAQLRIIVPAARPPCVCETTVYVLLFAYGRTKMLIYSVWDIKETLNHVWSHYTGGKDAVS